MKLTDSDWPMFGMAQSVVPALRKALADDRPTVLATLVRLSGPSPRPAGTQMLFDGPTATGYFSGGCIEADVANHALEVMQNGEPKHLIYGQGSPWIDIRLLCGGRVEIFLERLPSRDEAAQALVDLLGERKAAYWWSNGTERIVQESAVQHSSMKEPETSYSRIYEPEWRVVVIGSDPIALAIAQLSEMTGFETFVVVPNGPQSPPPVAGIGYSRDCVDRSFARTGLDRWTAVVAATHCDEIDDAVVWHALGRASYVGVLGSSLRVDPRKERLVSKGMDLKLLDSLHTPVGALRCGKAPWEVAVSVIAEVMNHRMRTALVRSL